MQIKKDVQESIKLKLKPDQKAKYGDTLKEDLEGPLFDLITKIFKVIAQTNIIIPGTFKRL